MVNKFKVGQIVKQIAFNTSMEEKYPYVIITGITKSNMYGLMIHHQHILGNKLDFKTNNCGSDAFVEISFKELIKITSELKGRENEIS